MSFHDGGTTSPTLLRRAADWGDLPAWRDLYDRYDPSLRRWCRGWLRDEAQVAEVCQRVWIELADRMAGFRYDPGRSFRGWLRELCRCRAIDHLRAQNRETRHLERPRGGLETLAGPGGREAEFEPEHAARRLVLLREAEEAQAAVRARVEPRTWDVYWRVAIEGRTLAETAQALGMTYTGAFAAYSRVDRRLREEGARRLVALREPARARA